MPQAFKVGLTGGIGAGKSEALRAFRAAGARALCADKIAHDLARKGKPAYARVAREFPEVLDRRGNIDRRALGEKVFAHPALRRRLEALTHPLILRAMRRFLSRARRGVVVADVPLLYEAGLAGDFDATVLVTAGLKARLARVMKRDSLSRAAALRRVRSQWSLARKERLADVVIRNDGTLKDLRREAGKYQRAFELIARAPRAW